MIRHPAPARDRVSRPIARSSTKSIGIGQPDSDPSIGAASEIAPLRQSAACSGTAFWPSWAVLSFRDCLT